MRERVVITGMGILCAVGQSPREVLDALKAGAGGLAPIRCFDASSLQMQYAGQIHGFTPSQYFLPHELMTIDRATQLAVAASSQAIAQAKPAGVAAERMGVCIGLSGAGQFQGMVFDFAGAPSLNRRAAFYHARSVPHFQTEILAARLGLRGPHLTFSAASAGSAVAIGAAIDLLRADKADLILAGGAEALTIINAIGMDSLDLGAEGPCSPFHGASGMSFGEGGAFVVLEDYGHAEARGAGIIAELFGHAITSDAYNPLANDPNGQGLYKALRRALTRAEMHPADIRWIKSSGTGHRSQDQAETLAIQQLYSGSPPPVCSLEPYLSHVNGATPVLGLVASLHCNAAGLIPQTLCAGEPRPGCTLDYVIESPRPVAPGNFLCSSVAFGGINAAIVAGPAIKTSRRAPVRDEIGISGIGLLSALGDAGDFFTALRQGRSGVRVIDRFDTARCTSRQAALVAPFPLPRRLAGLRRPSWLRRMVMTATTMALQSAGQEQLTGDQVGVVCALSRGAVLAQELFFTNICHTKIGPSFGRQVLEMGRFLVATELCHVFGWKGYTTTMSEGVSGGLHALIHGYEVLRQSPELDAMVVVAADEICPMYFRLFDQMGVLAGGTEGGMKLYQEPGSGMVLGEGAVALVLERKNKVRQRGGKLLAEVQGYGLSADSAGYQRMETEGKWLSAAVNGALQEAGGGGVDVVYGHGRGIGTYDHREVRAVGRVIGGKGVPLGCVMGNTGVAEASSGLFSVVAAVQGMQAGEVYPVIGGEGEVEGVSVVRGGVRAGQYRRALIAGSTESGNNAALVLALPSGDE